MSAICKLVAGAAVAALGAGLVVSGCHMLSPFRSIVGDARVSRDVDASARDAGDLGRDGPSRDGSSVPGTWVAIKAGSFTMGSPAGGSCRHPDEDRHSVTLTRDFRIQTTEVTQRQFRQLMGYSPAFHGACGGSCPVEQVSWHEAAAYCNALSDVKGLARCYACPGPSGASVSCSTASAFAGAKIYDCPGYRLPTEAEWEYAYRAGTTTDTYAGSVTQCQAADTVVERIAWYYFNSSTRTHPVGGKQPNRYGLYDMAGNVWEWCHDWYARSAGTTTATDPWGAKSGSARVLRGGSFSNAPLYLRAAERGANAPGRREKHYGFRCDRSLL